MVEIGAADVTLKQCLFFFSGHVCMRAGAGGGTKVTLKLKQSLSPHICVNQPIERAALWAPSVLKNH